MISFAYISSLELTAIGTYYSWATMIEGISMDEKDCSHLTTTTIPASETFIAAYYLVDRDAASFRNYRLCISLVIGLPNGTRVVLNT